VVAGLVAAPALRAGAPDPSTPLRATDLWLAPTTEPDSKAPLASAVEQLAAGRAGFALSLLSKPPADPLLGGYAVLYRGRAILALSKPVEAAALAEQLLSAHPSGYLNEAALLLAADAAEASGDWPVALRSLQALSNIKTAAPERVLLRLGRVALSANDKLLAADAFTSTYYDYPLGDEAKAAAAELLKLSPRGVTLAPTVATYSRDLARAAQFFGARRYSDARQAYVAVRPLSEGADRTLVDLRIAQCDFGLKRYAFAYEGARVLLARGEGGSEAEYLLEGGLRETGHEADYLPRVRAFVDRVPGDPFAEQALNDLGSYLTLKNDDAGAAAIFAELYERFPSGPHADRAAWKAGWWAYKNGNYAEAARSFESAAVTLRTSDFRPPWLYWAARSRERLGEADEARRAFRRVVADYRNSYYGRLAAQALSSVSPPALIQPASASSAPDAVPAFAGGEPPRAAPLIRALLAAGLYDDAVAELRHTQRTSGTSPLIEATMAYALNRRGELRPAITTMRRAYPQFLAEGGEALPQPMLAVIFPVQYWDLILKYSALHKLDPYVVAALINQESTFDAGVRSSANAWGLMQVLPSTGREYARTLGIAAFRTARLTDPETNIRIGTAFFADLLKQFDDLASALAAYNAGESRAAKWRAERPGVSRDQFIDDIPYPETQTYVKRIIGSAEDYRLLYPASKAAPAPLSR
jgi:soluble lytic murein transglycosylase